MNRSWKFFFAVLVTLAFGTFLISSCSNNSNSKVVVEVFYLPHPPAEAVVANIDKIVSSQKPVEERKISFDDSNSQSLIKKYKLEGHIPVAIFINGHDRFTIDGQKIVFRNFPKDNSFAPMGLGGNWSYKDFQKALQQELKAANSR
jgi:hypothetical protein